MCPDDPNVCHGVPVINQIYVHSYLFLFILQNVSVHTQCSNSANSLTLLSMEYVQFNTVYY